MLNAYENRTSCNFFFVSQLKFISEKVLQNQSFIDGFVDDAACYNKRVIFYQLIKTEIH